MHILSRSEEIVLMSVWKLHGNAYGITIRKKVLENTGFKWSIGAIYAPLHRLEKKGLVRTFRSDPKPERGGRSRICYEVTPQGKKALALIRRMQDAIWGDAPSLEWDET